MRVAGLTLKSKMDARCAVVITSDANYSRPLPNLLKTMRSVNITQSVLVTSDRSHVGSDVFCRRRMFSVNVLEIRTRKTNFEYVGFQKLQEHLNHTSLRSYPCFLMLHDTCEVSPRFESPTKHMFDNKFEVVVTSGTTSNIMSITRHGVSLLRVRNFRSKTDATYGEFRGHVLKPFTKEQIKFVSARQRMGLRDVFETGFPRTMYFYPSFNCYKYVYQHPTKFGFADNENAQLRTPLRNTQTVRCFKL